MNFVLAPFLGIQTYNRLAVSSGFCPVRLGKTYILYLKKPVYCQYCACVMPFKMEFFHLRAIFFDFVKLFSFLTILLQKD